ncbi:hypothetical protein MRX96_038476 [Rhipicephalus microplus]
MHLAGLLLARKAPQAYYKLLANNTTSQPVPCMPEHRRRLQPLGGFHLYTLISAGSSFARAEDSMSVRTKQRERAVTQRAPDARRLQRQNEHVVGGPAPDAPNASAAASAPPNAATMSHATKRKGS